MYVIYHSSHLEIQTLKGHTTCVNSLCIYPTEENKNLLLSGAYDTSIKLWDLRSKTVVNQFKGHSMQINALSVSPNCKLLASGSNDGQVKIWDITQAKLLASFTQHDNQITCLSFNPVDKALASGGGDRCVRYWDLDRLTQLSSTRTDTTPIQCILFEQNGKVLYSAANDSLKVWDVEHDCQLLDNVESSWRGVMDLIVVQERDQLLGLSSNVQNGFSLHGVNLKSICQETKNLDVRSSGGASIKRGRTPDKRSDIQTANSKPSDSEAKLKSKPSLQMQAQNILNQDYQYDRQKSNEQLKEIQQQQQQPYYQQQQIVGQPYLNNNGYQQQQQYPQQQIPYQYQIQQPQQFQNQNPLLYQQQPNQLYQQQPNQLYQQQQQNQLYLQQNLLAQQPQQLYQNYDPNQYFSNQVHTPQHNPQKPIQQVNVPQVILPNMEEEEYPNNESEILVSSDLTLSQFMMGDQNKEKFKQVDLIHEIVKDHNKVQSVLTQRMNYMKPILHWWSNNNLKSAMNAINQVQEPSILQDALSLYSQSPKFGQVPIDSLPMLLEKARILIESKYTSHIRGGLDFAWTTLNQFRDVIYLILYKEILNIKLFNQLSKADLTREERIQKYDRVIEQFKIIAQTPKLQKIIDRNKEDLSDLAKKFQIEVIGFLKKVNQNQMQN
ncbi:unnamed protein product (macronuclear) [Paramecium tetraurelia]|uniref:Katanin p80 subunit C-terminal domain-containing protein n=1 Tax=Paramecium tetraurelia TaxID=5888 RepID=A0CYP9_PARTE|nr:uncharacterized protein GSPATT00011517001 [Paramecium tetraurelia]CAK75916.1 unnamed protein product [Paramecium tetraurelia]|eukprot:XP_001443313.1 hypothetical protein (macronuclear) [Paramecium tetraurelia strain d4-2]